MQNLIKKLKAVKKKRFPSRNDKLELQEMLDKRTAFYRMFVTEGDICFDVGANVGNRVEPLLKAGSKVIAIEPQKKCYKLLNKKFGNSIHIVTDGVGAEAGEKTFYISNSSTVSSFSKEWIDAVKTDRFKNIKWNRTETVTMTTLDALIERFGKPTFIKIDVEGYELEVLKGLSSPVKTISFEYTVPEQTNKAIQCMEQIQKINRDTVFNYSIGESMEFALKEWLNFDEICEHVKSKEFIDTKFGDIYSRIME